MYALLVALIVVVILWFVLKPDWAPKPPDTSRWTGRAGEMSKQMTGRAGDLSKQATARAGDLSKQATARASQVSRQATAQAGQMYKGLRGQFKLRSDTGNLAKQFKQWVSEAALSKRDELYNTLPASADGFAIWLSGLSDKELGQFTERVARFCATLNFDIAWLNDAEVKGEPELKKAVEDSVLLYSLAAWRANNVQQDVKSFLAYRAWLANPNQHKAFGQQLHQVLIERGLVTVSPELYLAPEQERLEQAAVTIRKVAEENHGAFRAALRQVAGVSESAPPAAPAPVSEAPAPTPAPTPAAAPEQTEQPAPAQPTRRRGVAPSGVV